MNDPLYPTLVLCGCVRWPCDHNPDQMELGLTVTMSEHPIHDALVRHDTPIFAALLDELGKPEGLRD